MVEIDLAFTSSYIYSYRDFHVDPTILQGFCAICQLVANCHVYKLISQQKYTPLLPTKIMPFSFRDKKKRQERNRGAKGCAIGTYRAWTLLGGDYPRKVDPKTSKKKWGERTPH